MALTAEVTTLEENRVRLDVSVPQDEVKKELDRAVRKLAREVRIPGFRAGKVPPAVIMQRMGRDAVVDEMLRGALGSWYSDAVSETGLAPIDEPELDLDGVPEEGDLRFTATVQVRPRATLGTWKGLSVGKAEPQIDEADLDTQLEGVRQKAARLSPVERPAQAGDFAVIDFEGHSNGRKLRTAGARDYLAELGAGKLVPDFDEQLTGASAGDVLEFSVTYGPDDQRGELSGRTVDYTVTVKQVQERILPELDDDLALEHTEFETLDALRADIRAKLEERAQGEVDELFRRMAIDAVVADSTVEVPQVMTDRRVGAILNQTAQRLPEGVSFEDYLAATGQEIDKIIEELRPDAEMAIRRELVVEAIAEDEGIEITDEQIEEQVRTDAEATGRAPERLIEDLKRHGGWETMREELRTRAAVDALLAATQAIPMEQAEARERLWTPEDAREEEGAQEPAGKLWTPGDPS